MATGFSRRVISRTIAAKLLGEPARKDHWVKVLAAYLIEHNREQEIDLIANDIAHELYVQGGVLGVEVSTARELGQDVRKLLTELLRRETNAKRVEISHNTDQHLLGGLVARTPDAILDLSVRSKLKQLAAVK